MYICEVNYCTLSVLASIPFVWERRQGLEARGDRKTTSVIAWMASVWPERPRIPQGLDVRLWAHRSIGEPLSS